ncbi:MAG TPA: ATP-binding protein [Mucilaginibacter sp.]|nr:ATP-binding protein [Mucilaginibacter sp.]
MKRLVILVVFFLLTRFIVAAQSSARIDSLKHQLTVAKNDTSRILIMGYLCNSYKTYNFDSVAVWGKRALALAQKIGDAKSEIRVLYSWQNALENHGDIPESLELNFKAMKIAEENHYAIETALVLSNIGTDYWDLQDYPKAITYFKRALRANEGTPNTFESKFVHINSLLTIGDAYSQMNRLDSAFFFVNKVYKETLNDDYHPAVLLYLGDVLFKMGEREKAFAYLRESVMLTEKNKDDYDGADACKTIARFFKETNQPDSAIFYAKKGLAHAQAIGFRMDILINSKILAGEYEHKDVNQALYYYKLAMATNDEMFGAKKVKELQRILSEEQQRQRKQELDRIARESRLKQYLFSAGLAILLLIVFLLYRHSKQRKKANEILEGTLANLKATQAQLIHSEKMASLGELTAGIAHEIQNPLNFVNNFSEVSIELLQELKEEAEAGNKEDVVAIAGDLTENLDKIHRHGQRAGDIVKGMLQHSQATGNVKEETDINKLAGDCLNLAFNNLKVKDKDFDARLITHFDTTRPKLIAISQELSRVMLNLFNNAFYAVNQKAKTSGSDYKPEVAVTTLVNDGKVQVMIRDNGIGIPDSIKDKIMQPFFTTKPTGEGTGLGLSLSYDIVVKGYGGSIAVDTKEGEYTEFTVSFPKI